MHRPTAGCVVLAALALAGCGRSATGSPGGGSTTTGRSATGSYTSTASASSSGTDTHPGSPSPPRRPRVHGAPVGATQNVHAGSTTLAVTVTRLIDPLTDSGSALVPGTRPVGIMVTIRHLAGATYDSTASGDWSVISSSGPAAPLFVRRGVCQTPLTDFESLIGAGEARSGCVGFSVLRRARVLGVRFSPHSRPPGAVTWR